jgi:hypothetical protein
MINLIGWLGNIFFILGAIFLAKKWILGWYCQILGNLCYVIYAIMLGLDGISLCALSLLLIIINYYGLKKWRNPTWIDIGK